MAQSRLEKIGTIFTRVSGLLRSGAIKPEDKPIWYDVYAAFPPKLEPRFDRPAPNLPIQNIFYEEDVVRAKYHKTLKQPETVHLIDAKRDTPAQQFIKIYNGLRAQGALDSEQVFATAQELHAEQRQQARAAATTTDLSEAMLETVDTTEAPPPSSGGLLEQFREAKEAKRYAPKPEAESGAPIGGGSAINIQNLFKD